METMMDDMNDISDDAFWQMISGLAKGAGRSNSLDAFLLFHVYQDPDTPASVKDAIKASLSYYYIAL